MKSFEKKLHDLLIKVKDINRKHAKAAAKQKLDLKLDKLFDISPCSCMLEVLPYNDRRINCDVEDCQEEHIFCACNTSCKVPLEEQAYLKNQRLKRGPKRLYQYDTSVDRAAIKRFKRFSQTLIQLLKDNTIALETLPQSSTDTLSLESKAEVREKYYVK